MGVYTSAEDYARRLEELGRGARRRLVRAADIIVPVARKTSRTILSRQVYQIPIKRSASGRPLWIRTGDLLRRDGCHREGTSVVLENSSGHAWLRYYYGTPQRNKQNVARPPQQVTHWQMEAFMRLRAWTRAVVQAQFLLPMSNAQMVVPPPPDLGE